MRRMKNIILGQKILRLIGFVLSVIMICSMSFIAKAETLLDRYSSFYSKDSQIAEKAASYRDVLNDAIASGYKNSSEEIALDISAISGTGISFATEEGKTVVTLGKDSKLLIPFTVVSAGLYELEITYRLDEDLFFAAKRNILIDGKIPFAEAENVEFDLVFELNEEEKEGRLGKQTTISSKAVKKFQTTRLRDASGKLELPLKFALSEGSHTLAIEYVDTDMEIESIAFKAPTVVDDYATVSSAYPKLSASEVSDIFIEAEAPKSIIYTNDTTLLPFSDSDPATTSSGKKQDELNVIGGAVWSSGGQEICYSFDVKETGIYKLAIRLNSNLNNGAATYRRISIDGNVPFKEFLAYPFEYESKWHTEVLGENGKPYAIYLEKGTHTITFSAATSDEIAEIADEFLEIQSYLGEIYRKIISVTGTSPDPNYVYELDLVIPGLLDDLQKMIDDLSSAHQSLLKNSKGSANDSNLKMIIDQLTQMKKYPKNIAKKLDEFTEAMNTLSNLSISLCSNPLTFDSISIVDINKEVKSKESNFFQKMMVHIRDFIESFNEEYDTIFSDDDEVLDIWISRASEWTVLMQELIESDFEKKYDCKVKINMLPSGTVGGSSTSNPLLLAIASGKAPDVVMGVDITTPGEYGVRGAACNLKEFANFEEVVSRFHPEAMDSYTFLGGVYGVPETMNFSVLMYRTDIFAELGLSVPNTWDEVYYELLPVLYQNNFQMTPTNFDMLLYQNHGSYYTEDALRTNLSSPEAFEAFEMYINQYFDLGYPISYSFINRFRTGEMPIGFVDYTTYMQILTAAPELAGKFELALLPGMLQEDGSIRRTNTALSMTANMVLNDSDNKELAWKFIDWWSSNDIQREYGIKLESKIGASARWNSANISVYRNLPWNQDDLDVIYESWTHSEGIPYTLGGSIFAREVNNAFYSAVYAEETPRKALEYANELITDELIRKQEMYDIKVEAR